LFVTCDCASAFRRSEGDGGFRGRQFPIVGEKGEEKVEAPRSFFVIQGRSRLDQIGVCTSREIGAIRNNGLIGRRGEGQLSATRWNSFNRNRTTPPFASLLHFRSRIVHRKIRRLKLSRNLPSFSSSAATFAITHQLRDCEEYRWIHEKKNR